MKSGLKWTRRLSLVASIYLAEKENKGIKTTGEVSVSLTMQAALLSPPGLPLVLRPPCPSGVRCSLGSVGPAGGSWAMIAQPFAGEGVGC